MSASINPGDLRLGFGCSGAWGKGWFPEDEARRILKAAIDGGIAHIDTAGFYGAAEARLGRIVRDLPQDAIFISTKTGTSYTRKGARKDFSEAAIRADVEASLLRLGRERLDLLYLHGPNSAEMTEAAPALAALEIEGKIARAGVCGEGTYLDEAAARPEFDVVMGAYNFLRREHAPVFAKAKATGKATVAIAPLAQGLYADDFLRLRNAADAWRLARALAKNRAEWARARRARAALAEPGWRPAGRALGFVLANPNIDVAVTTTTRIAHLSESLDAARRTLPEAALRRLERFDQNERASA